LTKERGNFSIRKYAWLPEGTAPKGR